MKLALLLATLPLPLLAAAPLAPALADPTAAAATDCAAVQTQNQRRDEDSIRRIEHDWLAAELQGNTRYLECLLPAGYVNIHDGGQTRGAADIIAHSAKNQGKHPDIPAIDTRVVLEGAAATAYSVTQTHDKDGQPREVRFVDSFTFRDGAWHPYCGIDL